MEIYFSGTWGTITDSDWTSDDAQAVCRKLGYFKPGTKEALNIFLLNYNHICTSDSVLYWARHLYRQSLTTELNDGKTHY